MKDIGHHLILEERDGETERNLSILYVVWQKEKIGKFSHDQSRISKCTIGSAIDRIESPFKVPLLSIFRTIQH